MQGEQPPVDKVWTLSTPPLDGQMAARPRPNGTEGREPKEKT